MWSRRPSSINKQVFFFQDFQLHVIFEDDVIDNFAINKWDSLLVFLEQGHF